MILPNWKSEVCDILGIKREAKSLLNHVRRPIRSCNNCTTTSEVKKEPIYRQDNANCSVMTASLNKRTNERTFNQLDVSVSLSNVKQGIQYGTACRPPRSMLTIRWAVRHSYTRTKVNKFALNYTAFTERHRVSIVICHILQGIWCSRRPIPAKL